MARRPRGVDQTGARLKWKTVIIPFSTLQFWMNFLIVLGVLCAVMIGVYYQFLSPRAQARRRFPFRIEGVMSANMASPSIVKRCGRSRKRGRAASAARATTTAAEVSDAPRLLASR